MIHMGFIEFQRCDDDDGQMVMTSDFEKKKESEFRGRWLLLLLLGVGGDLILFSIFLLSKVSIGVTLDWDWEAKKTNQRYVWAMAIYHHSSRFILCRSHSPNLPHVTIFFFFCLHLTKGIYKLILILYVFILLDSQFFYP